MNANAVLRQTLELSDMILRAYLDDLTDADMLVRAVPGSNHIAWQLGHIIAGTQQMIETLGHRGFDLPQGFAARYSKETSSSDNPAQFATKAQCMALLDQAKAAAIEAIEATPESTLDQPAPESMREYAPTMAAALVVVATHGLMHAGQFVPVRRKLGKPPLF